MKPNYDLEMLNILEENKGKKVLLHSCCGPCSSYCIKELAKYLKVTVLYYNPNIEPKEEYNKRKEVQIKLINDYKKEEIDVSYIDSDYDNDIYRDYVTGYEKELEGGKRCTKCFELRLSKAATLAKKLNYDFFATTLTVSPHKNSTLINQIGFEIEKNENIKFLPSDFKKREGYKKSIEYSKKYDLYRQDYCGCLFSKQTRKEDKI